MNNNNHTHEIKTEMETRELNLNHEVEKTSCYVVKPDCSMFKNERTNIEVDDFLGPDCYIFIIKVDHILHWDCLGECICYIKINEPQYK